MRGFAHGDQRRTSFALCVQARARDFHRPAARASASEQNDRSPEPNRSEFERNTTSVPACDRCARYSLAAVPAAPRREAPVTLPRTFLGPGVHSRFDYERRHRASEVHGKLRMTRGRPHGFPALTVGVTDLVSQGPQAFHDAGGAAKDDRLQRDRRHRRCVLAARTPMSSPSRHVRQGGPRRRNTVQHGFRLTTPDRWKPLSATFLPKRCQLFGVFNGRHGSRRYGHDCDSCSRCFGQRHDRC